MTHTTASKRLPAPERRRQILAAALRVFARRGFHGATTRLIAEEAGVAEALLYRHFASKHDLFVAGVQLTSHRLLDGLQMTLAAHTEDPAAAMLQLTGFASARMAKSPELPKMVFIVLAELDDPLVRAAFLPLQERALSLLRDALVGWRDRGLLTPDVPISTLSWLVLGSFQVVAWMHHIGRPQDIQPDDAALLVQRFLQGSSPSRTPVGT